MLTRHNLLPFFLPIVLLSVLLVACGKPPAPPPPEAPAVTVQTLGPRSVNPYRRFVGRVRAVEDATLYARVAGYLAKKSFTEGDLVKAGAVLFTLDQEEFTIAVSRAEAAVNVAKAELTAAQRNFERLDELVKTNAVARRDYDESINRRDQATAGVAEAEAALARAHFDLQQTEIKAPFDGRVGRALVSLGDYITSQQPLTTLVTVDPMHVFIDIPDRRYADFIELHPDEQERRQIIKNMQVRLFLPNGSEYPKVGQFDFLDNRINARTGALRVRAVFANYQDMLTDGQFVNVQVEFGVQTDTLLVPQAAVSQDQLGAYVLTVDNDNVVQQTRVTTGDPYGVAIAIVDGLAAGDRVIVEGLQRARRGQPVQPVEAAAQAGDPQGAVLPIDPAASQNASQNAEEHAAAAPKEPASQEP